jgi:hypothetical protein
MTHGRRPQGIRRSSRWRRDPATLDAKPSRGVAHAGPNHAKATPEGVGGGLPHPPWGGARAVLRHALGLRSTSKYRPRLSASASAS